MGERQGIGHYVSERGNKYFGLFENDVISGYGRYAFPTGDIYEGQFQNGKFKGEGRYTFSDGTFMQGLFDNGQFLQDKEIDYPTIKDKVEKNIVIQKPNSFPQ